MGVGLVGVVVYNVFFFRHVCKCAGWDDKPFQMVPKSNPKTDKDDKRKNGVCLGLAVVVGYY